MMGGKERGDLLKILSRLFLALFLLVALFGQKTRAAAQEGGALTVSAPETGFFPTIKFRLDAYDAGGDFNNFLTAGDVQIIEDGQPLKPQSVEKSQNGLQVIIAINVSPVMAKRFDGATGYQLIQKALVDWARSQPAKKPPSTSGTVTIEDDISLATPTGLFIIREHEPELVAKGLSDYKPDLANPQPALGSLAEALDLATDPLDQPSTKRTILYITPSLPPSSNDALADLTSRAKSLGVRVNIWQLAETNKNSASSTATDPFLQMATDTGGRYQEINLAEPLPEIEPLFQPMRQVYQVLYNSGVRASGTHRLSIRVNQVSAPKGSVTSGGSGAYENVNAGGTIVSKENTFTLTVQPPNPIFLSPPSTVQRYWVTPEKNSASALSPEKVSLQVMVEFPDQHHRPLKATRLYVNNKLVAENTTEPFDRFDWPITEVTTTTRQMLRVEAVDSLDLTGASSDIPVEVLVDQPAKAAVAEHVTTNGMIAVGSVAAAGLVLALVLVFTNTQRRAKRKRQGVDKRQMKDPVTQPVDIRQDHSRPVKGQSARGKTAPQSIPAGKPASARASSAWSNPAWSRPGGFGALGAATAPARLITLDENEQPVTGGAILLTRQEITFGTDPQRATQVLDSPTVNELHARLYRSPEGTFYLADQGSISGTWINYAPVNTSGARLEHGDLIHIGKVMFRFELANPIPVEIKVVDLEQS
jgi:hypothetical protein